MALTIQSSFELATDYHGQKLLYVSGAPYFGQVPEQKFIKICQQLNDAKINCGDHIWEQFEQYAQTASQRHNQNNCGEIIWYKVDQECEGTTYNRQQFVDMGFPMGRTAIAIHNLMKDREEIAPQEQDYMVLVDDKPTRQEIIPNMLKQKRQP